VLALKKMYECELKLQRYKEGEMILRNTIEHIGDPRRSYQAKEIVSAKFDLVLHELNYSQESNTQKLVDSVRALLREKEFQIMSSESPD